MDKSFLEKILHGFAEVAEDETGAFRLYRVPRALLPELGVRVNMRCYHPAGGELRFRMKEKPVRFKFRRTTEPDHPLFINQTVFPVGVFHGDFQYTWLALLEGDNEFEIKPFPDRTGLMHRTQRRFNPELTRIILPPFIDLRIVDWEGDMELRVPATVRKNGFYLTVPPLHRVHMVSWGMKHIRLSLPGNLESTSAIWDSAAVQRWNRRSLNGSFPVQTGRSQPWKWA